MPLTHAGIYKDVLSKDMVAFMHRAFIELHGPETLLLNWHHEVVAHHLEQIERGQSHRFILNVPPRHLKSFQTSVVFVAWTLGHHPEKEIMFITYGQELTEHFSLQVRNLMESQFYLDIFETRLSSRTLTELKTSRGGSMLATSMAGVVTGRGADLIIIDDPLKADDALSDRLRTSVNAIYDNTIRLRPNSQNAGAIILVAQRLHADDLTAHVQKSERWDVLSLPAIAEHDEHYRIKTPYGWKTVGRKTGEALHPAHLPRETIEALRRSMTEYNFASQMQQEPQPPAGLVVERSWLRFYKPEEKPAEFDQIVQSWDTANKDTDLANYSVCTTWGITDKKAYLLNVLRQKLNFPRLKAAVREQSEAYDATVVLIEDKASGQSLLAELPNEGFHRARPAPTLDGDKIMRLRGQTAKIYNGVALFPTEAPWLEIFLAELLGFPNGKYDDQIDSLVYALAYLTQNPTPGIIGYYKLLASQNGLSSNEESVLWPMKPPAQISYLHAHDQDTGKARGVYPDQSGLFWLTHSEGNALRLAGWMWVDGSENKAA